MKFISFFKKQQNFHTKRGCPYPLGTTIYKHGINFAIFSEHATKVTLVLFSLHEEQPWCEIELDPKINKTGNIWHIFIKNLLPNLRYSYRMDGIYNPKKGHFFQEEKLLFDPYAKQLFPHSNWGENMQNTKPWIANSFFSWEDDTPPNIPWDELIMYELHVRGFTKDDSSCVKHPGTYLGLKEKIPYLQELGINAIELLPIHEFYETENINYNPITKERLYNYWGYSTNLFFVPKSAYAVKNACIEFREFVKACHKANIEVILDIVVNHTCEGNEKGPTLHFRGIDNSIYYLMNTEGNFMNFSGCGNTVQCQHIVVQEFILDVLRYWVAEMHVDGFRFDLASILCRDCQGKMLESPPLIERISKDPILKNCKLIAEPWDAGGAYQVGSFPHYNRWAEWNGYYRDKVRAFLKGDSGISADFANCLIGCPQMYKEKQRPTYHSINFVTCHDGFTLADLVSYNEPHNYLNGEDNKDGCKNNYSWNCGEEGPTTNEKILQLRKRQIKNFLTTLLISQGVPMLLAGDEFCRTQEGNNNAYCQDNKISWLDWNFLYKNKEIFRFTKHLIKLRKQYYSTDGKIKWHGIQLNKPDWSYESHSLALEIISKTNTHIYIAMNAFWEDLQFEIPSLINKTWKLYVDTSKKTPNDIVDKTKATTFFNTTYLVSSRSFIVLIAE